MLGAYRNRLAEIRARAERLQATNTKDQATMNEYEMTNTRRMKEQDKATDRTDPHSAEQMRQALLEIHEIAAREWKADETSYEWYGDIAGIVENLGIVGFDGVGGEGPT